MTAKTIALVLGLSVVTQPVQQRLAYEVADGTLLRRSYSGGIDLEFEGLSSVVAGQEVPSQYLPEIEMELVQRFELQIDDHVLRVADGRPTLLERSFEKGASSHRRRFSMDGPFVDPMSEEGAWDAESTLEGRVVRFTRIDDEDACESEYVGKEGPPFMLEGLVEDMDWRSMLPEDTEDLEIAVGARWECQAEAGYALLVPGGNLHWETPEYVNDDDMLKPIAAVDGGLKARIVAVDAKQQRCSIELEGELVTKHVAETDLERIPVADGTATATTTTTYELQGLLVWDLEHNHAVSLRAEADVQLESLTLKDEGQPGGDFESSMELRGTWELAMELVRVDSED